MVVRGAFFKAWRRVRRNLVGVLATNLSKRETVVLAADGEDCVDWFLNNWRELRITSATFLTAGARRVISMCSLIATHAGAKRFISWSRHSHRKKCTSTVRSLTFSSVTVIEKVLMFAGFARSIR